LARFARSVPDKLRRTTLLSLVFISIAFSILIVPNIPRAHAATCPTGQPCLSIVPSSTSVSPGGTLTLKVNFTDFPTFAGWDIAVKTDNTVLSPQSITLVETFGGTSSTFTNCVNGVGIGCAMPAGTPPDGPGVATSAVSSLGGSDAGSGTLFSISYKAATTPGSTTVTYVLSSTTSVVTDPTGASVVDCSVTANQCLTGSVTVATSTFSVSASPVIPSPTPPLVKANSTITVAGQNGFTGSVSLAVSAVSVVTATLNVTSVSLTSSVTSGAAKLTVSSATPGIYKVNVTGTSGASQTVTVTLNVADFAVSANPNPVGPLAIATNGASSITVSPLFTFTGVVNLAVLAPVTVTASLATPSVTIVSSAQTDVLTVQGTVPGIFKVNVTGLSTGYPSHKITVNVIIALNYTLSASPTSVGPIAPTVKGTSAITVTGSSGFSGTVFLFLSPPAGVTAVLNQTSVSISITAPSHAVTLNVTGSAAGTFAVIVTGTSAGFPNRTATVTLKVADFTVSAFPNPVGPIAPSAQGTSTITVTGLTGFSGTVTVSVQQSSGLTFNLNASSVTLSPSKTAAFVMLTVSSSAAGVYTATVTGSSPGFPVESIHTVIVTVDVAEFGVAASPTTISPVAASASGSSVITATGLNGFTGTIAFSFTSSTGLVASLSPSSPSPCALSSTVTSCTTTLTVSAVVAGNYNVNVTGSSAGFSPQTVTVRVVVVDFIVVQTVSGNLGPLPPTAFGSTNITISSVNGFAGAVSLKAAGSPGVSASLNVTSVSLVAGGLMYAKLTVNATVAGTYLVTVTGSSSGFLSHSAVVTVVVVDFALAAPSSIGPFASGVQGSSTFTVSALNGFAGTVNLAVASSSGLSASTNVSSVVLSSTVTSRTVGLVVSGVFGGNYSVSITGSVPLFPSRIAGISAVVSPPSISIGALTVSSTSVTVGQKISVNATLTDNSVSSPTVTVFLKWGDIVVAQKNVTLTPGQATPVSLVWDTSRYGSGNSALSVTVPASETVQAGPSVALSAPSSSPFSLGDPYFLGLLALIAVVVVSVVGLLFRRSRRPSVSEPATPKSS
jgi:hypothetical protein